MKLNQTNSHLAKKYQFFIYGGQDISKTVAPICMIVSSKMNYINMHTMRWDFVPNFSQKGNLFIFFIKLGCSL